MGPQVSELMVTFSGEKIWVQIPSDLLTQKDRYFRCDFMVELK